MRGLGLSALLALAACVRAAPAAAVSETAESQEHPKSTLGVLDFSLARYPDRQPLELSSLRGKVVLLDVWATWCEPCRDALPLYQAMQNELGAQGFKVVAVNVDADPAQIAKFLAETKLDLDIVLDPNGELAENLLKVKVMPTTFLLDRTGQVREVHEGFAEELVPRYRAEVTALLAEATRAPK